MVLRAAHGAAATGSATVSSSGVVMGVAQGGATIKYSVTNSCGTKFTTEGITVKATPNAGTISGSSTVCKGSTTTFTSNGTAGGTWSSSNTAIATVSSTGVVTGVAAGNATIKYTVTSNGCSAFATKDITVVNPSLVITCPSGSPFSRNANSSCKYIVSGSEFNATATGNCSTPALTYALSGATVVASSASNTSLAGKTLNKGTTTVTWTAKDAANHTATCNFNVTVIDNTAPVVTCKPNTTKHIPQHLNPEVYKVSGTEFNATATDNCGVTSLIYSLSGATVSAFSSSNTSLAGKNLNEGTTTITWKATDAAGKTSTCTTKVIVTDDDADDAVASAVTAGSSRVDPKISMFAQQSFSVKVSPNPSATNFKLQVESSSNEPVNIRLVDAAGRVLKVITKAYKYQVITVGEGYTAGSYFAEVTQGKNHAVVKLIKLN